MQDRINMAELAALVAALGNSGGGGGDVTDVQVNGVSVVTDGVANVPVASSSVPGVIGIDPDSSPFTIWHHPGKNIDILMFNSASSEIIKGGSNPTKVSAVNKQHEAAFYGIAKAAGDTTQSESSNAVGTYTDAAKSAIHEMLNGAVSVSGTTPVINALPGVRYVCGEVATLDITLPASGIVDVVFGSGATATVLTVTPPTGVTLKWANGFDATSLEANTVYEVNVLDGEFGVVGSWT